MKYRNKKIIIDNIKFDSKKEAARYKELKDNPNITNLQLQVPYELIPKQTNNKGKVIERSCKYIADFVYELNGEIIVEDTKGMKTPDYIIKRKLMLYIHGIKINEI